MRRGAVAEWLMAAVLKTAGAQALVSSNLTRSARPGVLTRRRQPSAGRSSCESIGAMIICFVGLGSTGGLMASDLAVSVRANR
jgi:hypothetical protein